MTGVKVSFDEFLFIICIGSFLITLFFFLYYWLEDKRKKSNQKNEDSLKNEKLTEISIKLKELAMQKELKENLKLKSKIVEDILE